MSYLANLPTMVTNNVPPEQLHAGAEKTQHNKIWVPRRCEREGCDEKADLKLCNGCGLLMYCSRGCQKADWKRHRVECKHLANLGLWGKPYTLYETCPCGGCLDRVNNTQDMLSTTSCNVCGATDALTTTPCCGITVCDKESQGYRMFSYSREFCLRSHMRYTMCGQHYNDDHVKVHGCVEDWRNCGKCRWLIENLSGMRWQGTNGYTLVPPHAPAKGMMFTEACDQCDSRIHEAMENHTVKGACVQSRTRTCRKCQPMPGM